MKIIKNPNWKEAKRGDVDSSLVYDISERMWQATEDEAANIHGFTVTQADDISDLTRGLDTVDSEIDCINRIRLLIGNEPFFSLLSPDEANYVVVVSGL
jgi:hypothetical protein